MIDNLFNLIINKSDSISKDFYSFLEKIDFNYTKDMISSFNIENLQVIKEITYVLYELHIDNFQNILSKVKIDKLINLYKICKTFETDSFIPYYKKSIINKYTNNST